MSVVSTEFYVLFLFVFKSSHLRHLWWLSPIVPSIWMEDEGGAWINRVKYANKYTTKNHEQTMLKLIDLGEDVLVSNVCLFIGVEDIQRLAKTSRAFYQILTTNAAYHLMFLKKFGFYSPFDVGSHDWKVLFGLHSSRNVSFYTWGSGGNGRLGYLVKDVSSNSRSLRTLGTSRPCKVGSFDGSLIQSISAGGFSFQILSEGRIYSTGTSFSHLRHLSPPGPLSKDNHALHSSIVDESEGVDKRISKFVVRMKTPPNSTIVSLSSGRQHFVALDDEGRILTWDTGMEEWDMGAYLDFPSLPGRASRISAGWDSTVCSFGKIGLVVVHSRENIMVGSHRCGWPTSKAIYSTIPGLSKAIDFVALEGCVIYIDFTGLVKVYYYSSAGGTCGKVENLNSFDEWLIQKSLGTNVSHSFTKIVGCFRTFVLFTDDGLILLGKKNGDDFIMEYPSELQEKLITDIVVGDYHFLATTKDGELLSWGLELQSNGCLGLGRQGFENSSVREEGLSVRVDSPTLLPKPSKSGQWLGAAAAGWHSGALYVDNSSNVDNSSTSLILG